MPSQTPLLATDIIIQRELMHAGQSANKVWQTVILHLFCQSVAKGPTLESDLAGHSTNT